MTVTSSTAVTGSTMYCYGYCAPDCYCFKPTSSSNIPLNFVEPWAIWSSLRGVCLCCNDNHHSNGVHEIIPHLPAACPHSSVNRAGYVCRVSYRQMHATRLTGRCMPHAYLTGRCTCAACRPNQRFVALTAVCDNIGQLLAEQGAPEEGLYLGGIGTDPTFLPSSTLYQAGLTLSDWYNTSSGSRNLSATGVPYGFSHADLPGEMQSTPYVCPPPSPPPHSQAYGPKVSHMPVPPPHTHT